MADFPNRITDLPGLSTWEDKNGINVNGRHYTPSEVAADEGLRAVVGPQNVRHIYDAQGGGFTADPLQARVDASISLNTDTGNIEVSAPRSFLDSTYYKEQYKPALLTMSQNYKLNPEYKYALMTDSDEQKTTGDWVKEFNDSFTKEVTNFLGREKIRRDIKNADNVELDDEGLIKMNTVAIEYLDDSGQTVKVTDDTLQSLPERIKNMAAFKNLNGWDKDKHTVSYKDLSEAWDREKVSDQDILDVYAEVENYFSRGDFSDPHEYAEMRAFENFIEKTNPHAGFFRGTADVVNNIGYSMLTGASNLWVKISELTEGLFNASGRLGTALAGGEGIATGGMNWVNDYLRPEMDAFKKAHEEKTMKLNTAAGVTYDIGYEVTPIVMQAVIGNALGAAASAGVQGAAEQLVVKMAAGETGLLGAAEGMSTSAVAKAIYNGTNFLLKMSNSNVANGLVAQSIGTLRKYEFAGKAAMTIADISAQTIVDVAMTDAKVVNQFLSSGDVSDDDKGYMLEQVAQNAVAWGTFAYGATIVKGIGGSEIGRVANATIAPKIAWLSSRAGQTSDAISAALHHGNINWRADKAARLSEIAENSNSYGKWWANRRARSAEARAQEYAVRNVVRQANRNIADLHITDNLTGDGIHSWSDLVKNADIIKREMVDQIAAANRFADLVYRQNLSVRVATMLSQDTLTRGARDSYLDSLTKVMRAEDAAGLGSGRRVYEAGSTAIRTLSKETNEYVNALYRNRIATAAKGIVDANAISGVEKEIKHTQEIINTFTSTQPAELVDTANELERLAEKFSGRIQDLRVSEISGRVMNPETLENLRNSDLFAQGYLRQQRLSEWDNYIKKKGEVDVPELRGEQHIKWGNTEEYQDISIVLFDDLNQVARQSIRKEMTTILDGIGIPMGTVVAGADTKLAKDVGDSVQKSVVKTIEKTTKDFVKNIDVDLFNNSFKIKTAKSAILTAEEKAIDSGAALSRATVKPLKKLSDRAIAKMLRDKNMLNDFDVRSLMETSLGKALGDMSEEELDVVFSRLSRSAQKELRDYIRDAYANTGRGTSALGDVTRKDLPKIRTSDYTRATGLKRKEAPDWLKPYLSEKQGQSMDEVLENYINPENNKSEAAWTQVEEFYKAVLDRPNLSKEGGILNGAHFKEAFYGAGTDEYGRTVLMNTIEPSEAENIVYRDLLAHNDGGIWDKEEWGIRGMLEDMQRDKEVFDAETLFKKNQADLEDLKKKYDIPQMETDLNAQMDYIIDGAIAQNLQSDLTRKTLAELGEGDDIAEYATLKSLSEKGNMAEIKRQFYREAQKEYEDILRAKGYKGAELNRISNNWAQQAEKWLEERIEQRYGEAARRLIDAGRGDVVDQKDIYARISAINQDITKAKQDPYTIKTFDAYGNDQYVTLSPTVASLFTSRPREMSTGLMGKIQHHLSRAFRIGAVGINPKSWMNQGFRDTGDAFALGNAWRNSAEVEMMLEQSFTNELASKIQAEMPDVWESLLARSEETGESMAKTFAKSEMERGAANVSGELESELYQFTKNARISKNENGIYSESVWESMQSKADKIQKKADIVNDAREIALRERVYNNSLAQALNEGMSLQQARRYADFIQAEATTNFGRQMAHLNNLQQTVPFLGAAINGAKSFWRLYAFDPVGVTTRIIGGYVVPIIALTSMSLSDEENVRVWKQIPEYQKENNLVFVVNGQIFSIPVPQEIGNFVSPVQHFIEQIYEANDNSFEQLMANDLVGFSPYDLQGYINIDGSKMFTSEWWEESVRKGTSQLASQVMPPLIKSAVIAATGTDPYTGKRVDTSWKQIDPETGEAVVMDYKTGALASRLGEIFGASAPAGLFQSIFENLFGRANVTILDGVTGLAEAVVMDTHKGNPWRSDDLGERLGIVASEFGEKTLGQAADALYIARYKEESNAEWNRAVSKLYDEKTKLMQDQDFVNDLKALSGSDLSEDARKKVQSRVDTKIEAFQQKVLEMSQSLVKEYGGTMDKNKFGSVISLMTFTSGYNVNTKNEYSSYLSSQEYKTAKASAIETMQRMGFSSAQDFSMFGYYKVDKDGGVEIQYNNPLTVLNWDTTRQLQEEVSVANIRNLVNDAGLYDAHEAINNQINAIYNSKKKLTNDDYAKINAIQVNWNAEVAKTIAPWVSQMTPEAAINNRDVRNYLYPYIEVPVDWEKNNYGKSVSLGDRGSKKAAYYESFIKSLYGIKDKYKGQY